MFCREFVGYSDQESTRRKVLRDVFSKGDLCFRSGDILVTDQYGYLYFKVGGHFFLFYQLASL